MNLSQKCSITLANYIASNTYNVEIKYETILSFMLILYRSLGESGHIGTLYTVAQSE